MPIANRVRVILAMLALCLGCAMSVIAAPIEVTTIGTPAWVPVDFHMFAAPIGTAATGYAEFNATTLALLPEPNHRPHPVLGVGPGDAHGPPYDQELAAGVSLNGFVEKAVFSPTEFSNGIAAMLVFMVIPTAGAPTGSSPDFASGPIIPDSIFPIHTEAESRRNGVIFSTPFGFDVPALSGLNPPFNVEGHSHFPLFFNENFDFALNPAAGLAGSYEFRISLIDNAGNGYQIVAPYQVVPEPATVLLFGAGLTLGLALRRKK